MLEDMLEEIQSLARFFLSNFLFGILAVILSPITLVWNYVSMSSEIWLETNPEQHRKSVINIQRQVKLWMGRGEKHKGQKMATARPSWKSVSVNKVDKSKYFRVSVNLNQIVKLDEDKRTVTLEPGVMMGQISRYLFKRGWTIPIVPEFESLSVGGLICGAGLETSSHKLGLFHDSCVSYEVVLPSAEIVTCSKETDPDLFYSVPGSYGTIGFLTAVTIPIIPAKRYVKHDYRRVSSIAEFYSLMKAEPNHDFVEGLAFSKDRIVLMFGDLDDGTKNPYNRIKVNHVNRWYKQAFYTQVEKILESTLGTSSSFVEYIPLVDYYHRHSRGLFWEIPKTIPLMNSQIFLFFFGWTLPFNTHGQVVVPDSLFKSLSKGHVVQDYIIPMSKAHEFLDSADRLLKIYPVWLCPVRMQKTPAMFPSVGDGDYIDLGYYSYPQAQGFHPVKTLQAMEQLTIKVKGFQGLYADCFMSNEQFREMFDTTLYDRVRRERGLESAFPDVYDKAGPKARKLDRLLYSK